MSAINRFLLENNLRISHNPCVSPDFCLDWPALRAKLKDGSVKERPKTRFETAGGRVDAARERDDVRLRVEAAAARQAHDALDDGVALADGATVFPATWENLLG